MKKMDARDYAEYRRKYWSEKLRQEREYQDRERAILIDKSGRFYNV